MAHRFITAGPGVPPASAPISHAVVAGAHCYISGQLSIDAGGAFCAGSAADEAARAFRNLLAVAAAAGFDRSEIVYVDIAFADLGDLAEVNALYAGIFPEGARPARTVYQAAALPFGARVKVQGIAVRASG